MTRLSLAAWLLAGQYDFRVPLAYDTAFGGLEPDPNLPTICHSSLASFAASRATLTVSACDSLMPLPCRAKVARQRRGASLVRVVALSYGRRSDFHDPIRGRGRGHFRLEIAVQRNPVSFLLEWRYHRHRIISERPVHLTTTPVHRLQTSAALFVSAAAVRIAKTDGWDLALPGLFG